MAFLVFMVIIVVLFLVTLDSRSARSISRKKPDTPAQKKTGELPHAVHTVQKMPASEDTTSTAGTAPISSDEQVVSLKNDSTKASGVPAQKPVAAVSPTPKEFIKWFGPVEHNWKGWKFNFHTSYYNPYSDTEIVALAKDSGHRVGKIKFWSDDDCGGVMTSAEFTAEEYLANGESVLSEGGYAIMDTMSIEFPDETVHLDTHLDKTVSAFHKDPDFDLNSFLFPLARKERKTSVGSEGETIRDFRELFALSRDNRPADQGLQNSDLVYCGLSKGIPYLQIVDDYPGPILVSSGAPVPGFPLDRYARYIRITMPVRHRHK